MLNLFCCDIGTSSIKAGILSETGRLLWWTREPLPIDRDLSAWQAQWWLDGLAAAVARAPQGRIDAVAVSGHGPTLVPVDAALRQVHPVLMWLDKREAAVAGVRSFFLPKVRWLQLNRPQAFAQMHRVLSSAEYVSAYLTGDLWTVTPNEAFKPFIWDADGIDAYRLDQDVFPPFIYPGHQMGVVSPRAAEIVGLPAGTPVFAGGSDFMMSLVGTGTIRPGLTCDRAGTSEGINHCHSVPATDRRLRSLPHLVDGYHNVAGILSSTGRLFEWFRTLTGRGNVSYAVMLAEIAAIPAGRHIPTFFPSATPLQRAGAAWEFSRGMFVDLGADHGPAEIGRAVVESIGFLVRDAVETLEANDCNVSALRVCGGQARNAVWNQMKADICGRPILVPEVVDAELVGDAVFAAIGLGVYRTVAAAVEQMVRFSATVAPRPQEYANFSERYCSYQERLSAGSG